MFCGYVTIDAVEPPILPQSRYDWLVDESTIPREATTRLSVANVAATSSLPGPMRFVLLNCTGRSVNDYKIVSAAAIGLTFTNSTFEITTVFRSFITLVSFPITGILRVYDGRCLQVDLAIPGYECHADAPFTLTLAGYLDNPCPVDSYTFSGVVVFYPPILSTTARKVQSAPTIKWATSWNGTNFFLANPGRYSFVYEAPSDPSQLESTRITCRFNVR